MGGSAFSRVDPPIMTPRMPRDTYDCMLGGIIHLLSKYYVHIVGPPQAPGKQTFGDIDILVYHPLVDFLEPAKVGIQEVVDQLKSILGAKIYILTKNDPVINFAVPWSDDEYEMNQEQRFVQVDIQICKTFQDFNYGWFYDSHGDLWRILNTIIKPFGLLVNNRGMFLRIVHLEKGNRKRARVLATSDPYKILSFLGLDFERWWKKFDSLDEMFNYAASCRLFILNKINEAESEQNSISEYPRGYYNEVENLKRMNNQEKKLLETRPHIANWIFQFVPDCRAKGLHFEPCPPLTSDQIKKEIFHKFNLRKQFEDKEWELALENNTRDILKSIKGSIPDETDPVLKGAAIRFMRKIVEGGSWKDGGIPDEVKKDDNGLMDIEKLKRWVGANWMEAGKCGLAEQAELSNAKNKLKVESETKQEENVEVLQEER